jgi:hypothetical protein
MGAISLEFSSQYLSRSTNYAIPALRKINKVKKWKQVKKKRRVRQKNEKNLERHADIYLPK